MEGVDFDREAKRAELVALGADGLVSPKGGCGCGLDDLAPADCFEGCLPARETECLGQEECEACEMGELGSRCFYPLGGSPPPYK